MKDVESWNDAFARKYDIDAYYNDSGFLIRWVERLRLRHIRKMVAAQASDRILEVGCGGGHVLRMFPKSDLTGVDVSGEMIRKAQRNLKGLNVTLLKGELHQLDLDDHAFDKIICTEVLEHVVDPELVLGQMQRLLRPGGRVVVTFPNDPLVHQIKHFIRKGGLTVLPPFRRISWGGDHYHLHIWKVKAMRELLSRFFEVETVRYAPLGLLPIRCCFQCRSLEPRPTQ